MPLDAAKSWLVAARPHTLSAALVPVLVGSAWAAVHAGFGWDLFALTLAGALLVQVGANLADEYADHDTPAAPHKYHAPHKVIARGLLSHAAVRRGAYAVFAAATLIGAVLVWRTGWPLLVLCLSSLAVAWAYSAGPRPLGDYALGEVLVFVWMGPVMVGGTVYVQAPAMPWGWWWAGLAVGGLVTCILMVNNLRDLEEDRRAGRATLAVLWGAAWVRLAYRLTLLAVFLLPLAPLAAGGSARLLLPWATLPLALRLAVQVRAQGDRPALHGVLKGTSALHLLYGLLLAAALLWEGVPR